jgi:hypothetical protein
MRENIKLGAIYVCGAEFDGDIFCCIVVDSEPGSGECAMAKLVHNSIPFAKSIVDMNWMIAAGLSRTTQWLTYSGVLYYYYVLFQAQWHKQD